MSQSQQRTQTALVIGVVFLILAVYSVYTNYKKTSSLAPHKVMIAIERGDVKAVEDWLSPSLFSAAPSIDWMYEHPDPGIEDATGYGQTFLTDAVDSHYPPKVEIVRLLVSRGADVNKRNVKGESPLALARKRLAEEAISSLKPQRQEIVNILLQAGAKE